MDVDPRLFENVKVSDNEVRKIVLSYLVHNCFKETAETFIACSDMKRTADCSVDIDKRKLNNHSLELLEKAQAVPLEYLRSDCHYVVHEMYYLSLTYHLHNVSLAIYNHVLEGNVLKAIELTDQLAVDLLASNPDVHFALLTLHFVELVRAKDCASALQFAQGELRPFGKQQDRYREKLQDCMALLAYEEPEKSPLFQYLTDDYRQTIADELNSAVLAHANLPSYTSMERLLQHTTLVRQRLNQELGKDGPPTFTLKAFLKN